jgi:hypothetical protein
MESEAVAHLMEQTAHTLLRRGVLAADAAHVPTASFFGQSITHDTIVVSLR